MTQTQTQNLTKFQKAKNFAVETFSNKKAQAVMVVVPAVTASNLALANTGLPEINIDVASLMKAFAVIIAAIATIGMGVLTVALMARAFKYIKTAL